MQRDFSLLERRGEDDEACMHVRIFYCQDKRSYFQPLNAKEELSISCSGFPFRGVK